MGKPLLSKCGNRMEMDLLLTTDEEASKLLFVRRFIGKAKRVGQRCIEQPEQLRSEDQTTRENASAPLLDAIIAFGRWKSRQRIAGVQEQTIATGAIFWRKCLLRTINIGMTFATMSMALRGHRGHVGNGDRHGSNFHALVAMQAQFDPVLQDLPPAGTARYLNATIQTEKCLSQVSQRRKWNNTTRCIIQTIRNTRRGLIFETPHYDYSVTGQTVFLSMGPECDATLLSPVYNIIIVFAASAWCFQCRPMSHDHGITFVSSCKLCTMIMIIQLDVIIMSTVISSHVFFWKQHSECEHFTCFDFPGL